MVYSAQHRNISILMLPWLGHGHISPFLELAKKLTSLRDFHIFICSTPVKSQLYQAKTSLRNTLTVLSLWSSIFHTMSCLNYHLTTTPLCLPPISCPLFKKAFDMSSDNFSDILKTLKPDLLYMISSAMGTLPSFVSQHSGSSSSSPPMLP
ncbi:hypothetical protein ACFXTO_028425 [Malus domestica]